MNFDRLEKNITDIIAEQQIKLGYRKEKVELYYLANSLNHLLGMDGCIMDISKALVEFSGSVLPRLGKLHISNKEERFCITIPPEGSEYVHGLIASGSIGGINFLEDFLAIISRHNLTIDDVIAVFSRYSSDVHIEKMEDEDFEYLIYFENGLPDAYRYCINFEGQHLIYHRFTIEDYRSFGFKHGTVIHI